MDGEVVRGSGPALLEAVREPLAARWSGDDHLDAALACPTAREAATVLFGDDRATRPVIRALARSLLGPPAYAQPGRNACLYPVAVVLGVDPPGGVPPPDRGSTTRPETPGPSVAGGDPTPPPERLAADDIARILAAAADDGAPARRQPIDAFARQTLWSLVAGFGRRRRVELAATLVTDTSGAADGFLRALADAAELAYVPTGVATRGDLPALTRYLRAEVAALQVPSRRVPLAGASRWRGRDVVDLPDGWQVRVPWNRQLLEREGEAFRNCLASWYLPIHVDHAVVATVWRHGRPVAAAEVDRDGDLVQVLGVKDTSLARWREQQVEDALVAAGVLPEPSPGRPRTLPDRVAARIACRAVVLVADELDGAPDHPEVAWRPVEVGDRCLELLGPRATLLTDVELDALRRGCRPDPIEGWATVGAMLVAAGVRDPHLVALDGRALFRQAARAWAWGLVAGTRRLAEPLPSQALLLALGDERLPAWQHAGFQDVLDQRRCDG